MRDVCRKYYTMNNTISVVALTLCMVMLNQVLGLPSGFSMLK